MHLSLKQKQKIETRLEQRCDILFDDVHNLWIGVAAKNPEIDKGLREYFSPTKSDRLERVFTKYIKTEIFSIRDGSLNHDQYLSLVLSFQFTARLLGFLNNKDTESEMFEQFSRFEELLKRKYGLKNEPILKFDLSDDYDPESGFAREMESLRAYNDELNVKLSGKRYIEEYSHDKIKENAITAIKGWQHVKEKKSYYSPEALLKAFGWSIVIPSFFDIENRKVEHYYRSATPGIEYYIEVPKFLR